MKVQLSFGLVFGLSVAFAGPLDELTPRPRTCTAGSGTADAAVCANPVVRTGAVDGAPERTAKESYRLEVRPDGAVITAPDARGVRYAKVTLDQLVRLSDGRVPCCTITDWPQFPWRGLMHDCGRNYLDMDSIRRILDLMALYKLNLFHWHITDYYGWRLESKKYPMLQAAWAFRRQMNRYYTQDDFRAILAYAGERGITVMPELDVPGHTLAFRRGLGIEHMAEQKVKGIVGDLIDELCTLASAEEMPFVHLGTDEARTPYEQVPDSYCPFWADRVRANGRLPVGWTPGKPMTSEAGRKSVKMIWHAGLAPQPDEQAFDTVGCYFASKDPLTFLCTALSLDPCAWAVPDENKLGAVICSWHDDFLGEDTSRALGNCNFAPAVVFYSGLQWSGAREARAAFAARLPAPGTPEFAAAEAVEDRIVAQRDKVVIPALGLPFSYVRQTQLRWRISTPDGKVVAKDVAQASVMIAECGRHKLVPENSYIQSKTGTAILETWIRSPKDQTVGAWIGFTRFGRSGGRGHGLPEAGEWGRSKGVTVEVNGNRVPAPEWTHPGLKFVMTHPEEPTSNNVAETPFTNEEYFMREPSRIVLKSGWNHVKLTVPKTESYWAYDWAATFVPVTLEKFPREVAGLAYSSDEPPVSGN